MEILSHGGERFYGMLNPHNAVVEQMGLGLNQKYTFLPFDTPPSSNNTNPIRKDKR